MKLGDIYVNKKINQLFKLIATLHTWEILQRKALLFLDKWKDIMHMKLAVFLVLMDMDHEKKLNQNMNY